MPNVLLVAGLISLVSGTSPVARWVGGLLLVLGILLKIFGARVVTWFAARRACAPEG